MANTEFAKLPALSNQIYKEWYPKTVLVQSCDNSFEGELNLQTRELDIPVYHDLSIYQTTIKERELKPAPLQFIKASTKRVTIDRGRYSHWGQTSIGKLIDRLSAEDSEVRKKLVNKWAVEAEKELAEWVAFSIPAKHELDLSSANFLNGVVSSANVMRALDILQAKVIQQDMEPTEFTLFASEKFEQVLRDTKISLASQDADATFRTGFVGIVNGVEVRRLHVQSITTRDQNTAEVLAEIGIWKTRDGIQYVVPFKNTISYEIQPNEVLMGGMGYQTVEYYDFFNLYPGRLFRVKMKYDAAAAYPTK
ncbi:MAG: hypothetical protein ACO3BB_00145 [Bacilli bacterium]